MAEAVLQSMLIALWPVGLAVIIAALLEWLRPWRRWNIDRLRWLHAAILYIFGIVVTNIIVPIGHAGVALIAVDKGWGLLNAVSIPSWAAVVAGVLILDLAQWACHWAMHHSPLIWRIHRLHHSDEVIDTSTAFRFHPLETLSRFLARLAVILVFGVPAVAIGIAAVLSLAFDVWEHANVTSPRALRRLSGILITPDLHRIHHSSCFRHQGGNLGTIFAVWDRLFGTYIPDHELDDGVTFGLGPKNRLHFRTLADLILDPFRKA